MEQWKQSAGGLWLATILCAAGYLGLASVDARHGTLRDEFVTQSIVWYLVAFAGFGVAVWSNEKRAFPTWVLWVAPLAFRLVLFTTTPTLSDDVYRYLWDGHLVSQGVNPYAHVISDPSLDQFSIPARDLTNNRDLASPYLPTIHGVFGLAALTLPSSPLTMQMVMVGFDLLVAATLTKLLKLSGLPSRRVLLYLWNPLVIVEIAHGAHLDALMVALTTAALLCTFDPDIRDRWGGAWGPSLLALATLTRPLPLLLVPVLFWRWSWRQRFIYGAVTVGVTVPWGIRPGFGLGSNPDGTGVFGAARAYSDTFRFNSGIYHWYERWVGGLGLDDKGWDEPVQLAKILVGVVVAGLLLMVFIQARTISTNRGLLRLAVVSIGIYVVLTPVLHPWYTVLLFTLLVFVAPSAEESKLQWLYLLPWLYLAAALVFSYLTYEDPDAFAEREWVRELEWIPTLGLLGAVGLASAFGVTRRAPRQPAGQ